MIPRNLLMPSKNFIMDPFGIFSDSNRMLEEPLSVLSPKIPMAENYWPIRPWTPACDIFETDSEIVLKFELPEVKKEHVKVTMENHLLTLRGERKFEEETNRENYHRVERHYGDFMGFMFGSTHSELRWHPPLLMISRAEALARCCSANLPRLLPQMECKIGRAHV